MFLRRILIDQETQSSDAATRRLPLPRRGILSGLEVRCSITNGATRGTQRVFDAITRIQVVADGSNVLFDLEGAEAYRWAHHFLKIEPPHIWDETNAVVQRLTYPIAFGRWLGDEEFALDLSQFRDVELRIQFAPTIGATAFATGTTQFHVIAIIDDEGDYAGRLRGYLRTVQVNAFTSLASGDTQIELARTYPYFDIHVSAREATTADGVNITRAQVWANDRSRIPFDGRWDDIQALNESEGGVESLHDGRLLVSDTNTFDTFTGRIISLALVPVFVQSDANGIITVMPGSIAGDRVTMSVSDTADAAAATHFTAAAASRDVRFVARGLGVGNSILIPFVAGGNPDLALQSRELGRLQLVLTNGDAGADVRVSTREWVPQAA
jgi:hypothetical protein